MGLIISGMHRSGTSAAARVVASMGLEAGDSPLMGPALENPRGFFERQDVAQFNDGWLRTLGGSWWAPASTSASTWRRLNELELRESRQRLDLFWGDQKNWYVKDPRISLLLPLWDRLALTALPTIVMVRNPLDVAESLRLRNGFSHRRGLALWSLYYRQLVDAVGNRPHLIVDYDSLVSEPTETVGQIAQFVASTGHQIGDSWSVEGAIDLVESGLRRSAGRQPFMEDRAALASADELFEQLAKRHVASAPTPVDGGPLPAWAGEVLDELRELWEAQERLQGSASEVPALENALRESATEREHALSRLASVEALSRDHGATVAALRTDLQRRQTDLRSALDAVDATESQLQVMRQREADLEAQLAEADSKALIDEQRAALLKHEIAELRTSASSAARLLDERAIQIRDAQIHIKSLDGQIATLSTTLIDLRAAHRGELENLQTELTRAVSETEIVRHTERRRREAMTAMSLEMERRRSTLLRTNLALVDANQTIDQWRPAVEELEVARHERDNLAGAVEAQHRDREALESELLMMKNSRSWRYGRLITAPVRQVLRWARQVRGALFAR